MGSTDRERQRLMRQGAILREFLETAFRAAGIGPGMRDLDIGSGVGDVSLLAADPVGTEEELWVLIATRRTSFGL
jgi:ubiquinone/menaquinone biosynthesis C-methylase UbiE